MESGCVHFYGFKNVEPDEDRKIRPLYNLKQFILYKGGKIFANNTCTCQDYDYKRKTSNFEMTVENRNLVIDLFYLYGLVEARNHGYHVPNCYLCKHHKYDSENKCIYCESRFTIVEKGCNATSCKEYEFDEGQYLNINSDLVSFRQNRKIDLWKKEA